MCNGKDEIAGWIVQSIWLDLAYDEENESLLKGEEEKGTRPNLEDEEAQVPPTDESPDGWFSAFLYLKGIRIRDGLAFDKARHKLAELAHQNGYSLSEESKPQKLPEGPFTDLRVEAMTREENLDSISWRCGAALDHLQAKYREDEGKEQNEEWATLLALFHSEFCASATPDISFGVAKRFAKIVPNETQGKKLFDAIARHNVARGQNHLTKPLDATKTLDQLVDDLQKEGFRKDILSAFPGNWEGRKEVEEEHLLDRIIYFPAIRTLAQAYDDLGRHAEQEFYLTAGREDAKEHSEVSRYWEDIFALKIHLLDLDLGRKPVGRQRNGSELKPRAREEWISIQVAIPDKKDTESRENDFWWLLLWHAAEEDAFRRRLENTARELTRYLEDEETGDKSVDKEEGKLGTKSRAIARLLFAIKTNQCLWKNKHWGSLVPTQDQNPPVGPEPMRGGLWTLGAELLRLINHILETNTLPKDALDQERATLQEWQTSISDLLQKGEFQQFRSEAESVKLFPFSEKDDCPGLPSTESREGCLGFSFPKSRERRVCKFRKTSCAYETLHLAEKGNSAVTDERKIDAGPFASLNYYFSTMAAQQDRFLDYLRSRTCQMRNFRQGEPPRPAANFELISLRRWNSFSPNLGSRAAASVGGGYLVRIWLEKQKRYVGIGVDPGYNYLENLFNEGFTIPDIDILLITHAHPDHTENLTNFFTLLRERRKRLKKKGGPNVVDRIVQPHEHQIILAMTEGVFERYASHLKAEKDFIRDIVVLKAKKGRGSEASAKELMIEIDSLEEDTTSESGPAKKDYPCYVRLIPSDGDTKCGPSENTGMSSPGRIGVATLQANHAWHHDGTGHDSIGVVITKLPQPSGGTDHDSECEETVSVNSRLGIISDSRYHPELEEDYCNCSLIVAHLGGLLRESQYSGFHEKGSSFEVEEMLTHLHGPENCPEDGKKCSRKQLRSILEKENHLYLPGFCRFVCDLITPPQSTPAPQGGSGKGTSKGNGKMPIFVLSEFGEELRGGLRTDLTRRLQFSLTQQRNLLVKDDKQEGISILPCDVGLRIDIEHQTTFCSVCHRYVQTAEIRPESVLPGEEALAYVCDDCRTLRKGELPELLQEWCQTGRPVVPLDRSGSKAGRKDSTEKTSS